MKTRLEEFSEKVAATTLDLNAETLNTGNKAIDIVTITAIIQAIGQIVLMFQNCPKPPAPASILNPSWIERIQFRMMARNVINENPDVKIRGLSTKVANACFVEAAKMKEDEINQVLNESDAISNWLI